VCEGICHENSGMAAKMGNEERVSPPYHKGLVPRGSNSPVQFMPATGEWKFHTNSFNRDYVRDVLADSELQEVE